MTPRALLTAIGATAIGFAVVIGSAATSGFATPSATATSAQITEAGDGAQTLVYSASALTLERATGAVETAVSWSEDCPLAL